MDARSALAELARDTDRGAAEITQRARRQLARLPEQAEDPRSAAREAALGLLNGHPSMAPIVHLANETLQVLHEEGPTALEELPREPPPAERVAQRARARLAEADAVVTYSRSGTVLAALEHRLENGPLRVITSEARPGNEGLAVARRLTEKGADVELTYDAHLPTLADEADLALVGADAITEKALVNKAGTGTLLARARAIDTPALVLAAGDKIWPAQLDAQPSLAPEGNLEAELPENVRVRAPLFERVDLALAEAVVTEDGPLAPEQIAERARAIDVHPDVADALA